MARPRRTSPTRSSTGSTWTRRLRPALSLHALVDSRDGADQPEPGLVREPRRTGCSSRASWAAASNWQQLSYDARTYFRLTPDARHKLAFWLFGDFVTAGTAPYLDLPATGMDTYGRSGRGYPQGRFRGERLVYGEAEYRWTVTKNGLFGMVAFLNTETLSNEQTGEKLFDSFATGRRLRLPPDAEQALEDQPLPRLRLGQGRLERRLLRRPGGLLKLGVGERASAGRSRGARVGQSHAWSPKVSLPGKRVHGRLDTGGTRSRRMPAATLTAKGQIGIPAEIRERYQLTPGTQVEFIHEGGAIRLVVRRRVAHPTRRPATG